MTETFREVLSRLVGFHGSYGGLQVGRKVLPVQLYSEDCQFGNGHKYHMEPC